MKETLGQLLDDPNGFHHWINHAALSVAVLKLAAETGLCAHLSDAPMAIETLAERCAVPADALRRLVDYLACEEVLALTPDGEVVATPQSRRVHELTSMILVQSRTAEAGLHLLEGLRRGTSGYEARFGAPVFTHLAEEPALVAHFSQFMGYLTRRIEEFVFTHHEFRPFTRAVDVGGSHGDLLKALLARHPQAHGVLFDLPATTALVAGALRASPQGDRIEVVGGSSFEAVPAGDLYLIKMILHDWDDADCVALLKNVRATILPGGRVAVIEHLLPRPPRRCSAQFMDIGMMVWATGRERRLADFEALFGAAGFRLDRVTENPAGQSVIEAVPAS